MALTAIFLIHGFLMINAVFCNSILQHILSLVNYLCSYKN